LEALLTRIFFFPIYTSFSNSGEIKVRVRSSGLLAVAVLTAGLRRRAGTAAVVGVGAARPVAVVPLAREVEEGG